MTEWPFQEQYAEIYDLIYADKDYEAESTLLVEAFDRHSVPAGGTVLDLGCGTGGHAIPLARRGYAITGVERSAAMLLRAQKKASTAGVNVEFVQGDIRALNLSRRFDACICMFAVLGYQLTNDDVEAVLKTVRTHLKAGAPFIFDFWYGPAVLAIRPSQRIKIVRWGDEEIIRLAWPTLDIGSHINETVYRVLRLTRGKVLSDFQEVHRMRYFFPQELRYFLRRAGLGLRDLRAFPEVDREADERTWNAIGFAVAEEA